MTGSADGVGIRLLCGICNSRKFRCYAITKNHVQGSYALVSCGDGIVQLRCPFWWSWPSGFQEISWVRVRDAVEKCGSGGFIWSPVMEFVLVEDHYSRRLVDRQGGNLWK